MLSWGQKRLIVWDLQPRKSFCFTYCMARSLARPFDEFNAWQARAGQACLDFSCCVPATCCCTAVAALHCATLRCPALRGTARRMHMFALHGAPPSMCLHALPRRPTVRSSATAQPWAVRYRCTVHTCTACQALLCLTVHITLYRKGEDPRDLHHCPCAPAPGPS